MPKFVPTPSLGTHLTLSRRIITLPARHLPHPRRPIQSIGGRVTSLTDSTNYNYHAFVSSPIRRLAQPRQGVLVEEPWLRGSDATTTITFFTHTGLGRWQRRDDLDDGLTSPGLDSGPSPGSNPKKDHKPPDERILKLGKTLRILSPLLPNLLTHPLPHKILSPNVTLHLFPSTHPHLPTVKGRTLYRAALWTVPVAWSSVPLLGNVKLQILSERIVRAGTVLEPDLDDDGGGGGGDERLVVRWRTEPSSPSTTSTTTSPSPTASGRTPSSSSSSSSSNSHTGTNKSLSVLLGGDAPIFKLSSEEQFTGLFIFSFDEEGRILTHTIEHADDANGWERTAKFVTLTDWLIGKARGAVPSRVSGPEPGLAAQGGGGGGGGGGCNVGISACHEP